MLCSGLYVSEKKRSGAHARALIALLLLTLPEVLTFHVLLELPLLAERKRLNAL